MEDVIALKTLFESFERLSKSGKGLLVAYGQGLQTMEEMNRERNATPIIKEEAENARPSNLPQ